jgi:hypothetical protein
MTPAAFNAAMDALRREFQHSIGKHGDWSGYTEAEIHKAVTGEYREFTDAVIRSDIHGDHGQRAELLQLAVVAIKGFIMLECVDGGVDSDTRQLVGG